MGIMPNDAKLGLVTGLALVMLIAATYYRKDSTAVSASETAPVQANQPVKDSGPAPTPALPPPSPAPALPLPPPERPAAEDPFAPENSRSLPVPLPLPPAVDNTVPALPPP